MASLRILRKGYSVPQDFSWIENYKLISKSVKYATLLHINVTYIKENIITKLQNYTAHPETLGQAINCPCYFWKFLQNFECLDNEKSILNESISHTFTVAY